MLQYLLNATAIWLISLVLFDVFLRRESYHNYNRFYLLFTFLLGALLPLLQWQGDSTPYPAAMQQPLDRVIVAKQTIVQATTPEATAWDWQQWLIIAYVCGALVMVALLIIDIFKLLSYYRSGKRSAQGSWTVIETSKDHAPFSFRNTLFVSSISVYNEDEWHMILIHERRHTTLFHFADLLLMQLSKIIFWFHPLVYLYNKRLLLVHEFQADNASAQKPQIYGRFLVEQALLQTAPNLSHSFNRSPIKNRIIMLTRKSTTAAKIKMLVFVPLAVVSIVCFSKNAFSQKFERNGNTVIYNGNKFELSALQQDTVRIASAVTGREFVAVNNHMVQTPVKMNGMPIANKVDKKPYFNESENNLRSYLIRHLKKELSGLKDGMYTINISSIVVDETGKIVYFDYANTRRIKDMNNNGQGADAAPGARAQLLNPGNNQGRNVTANDNANKIKGTIVMMQKTDDPSAYEDIDKTQQQKIFNKICKLTSEHTLYLPATANGKKVIALDDDILFWNSFKVKNHKLYDLKEGEYVAL